MGGRKGMIVHLAGGTGGGGGGAIQESGGAWGEGIDVAEGVGWSHASKG